MTETRNRLSFLSGAVFLSGCIVVFIFNGSFKGNGIFISNGVIEYETSFTLAGGAYVAQFSLTFLFAGIGGSALDSFSYRFLAVCGGFLFGLGFTCQGAFGRSIWHLLVNMAITATGGGLLHFALYISFVEHFGDKFSVMYSLREMSTYLGVSIIPPLIELLQTSYGLNGSYLVLGAIAWNCIVCGLLLKPPHGKYRMQQLCGKKRFSFRRMNCFQVGNRMGSPLNEEYGGHLRTHFRRFVGLFSLAPATKHPRFAIFLIIHSLLYYTFASWALFLVPFGMSLGFSQNVAVFLSTAGGVGGFVGKTLVVVVFHLDKMNIISAGLIPSVICCIGLTGYILTRDYFLLLICSSFCGFSLAFGDSALSAMLPGYLCKEHLKQGTSLSFLFGGICMQLGGILSGAILDLWSSFIILFGAAIVLNIVAITLCAVLKHIRFNDHTEENMNEH